MKYVRLPFTSHLLVHNGLTTDAFIQVMNKLPKNSKIIGFGMDQTQYLNYMFVSNDLFTEVPEGTNPPNAFVICEYDRNGKLVVTNIDYDPGTIKQCVCEWVEYVGLTNRYEYCKKCGIKKT